MFSTVRRYIRRGISEDMYLYRHLKNAMSLAEEKEETHTRRVPCEDQGSPLRKTV